MTDGAVARRADPARASLGTHCTTPPVGEPGRTAARRWAVELPAELGGANVLNVSMTWRNARDGRGNANFWTGIRPDRAQPAPQARVACG